MEFNLAIPVRISNPHSYFSEFAEGCMRLFQKRPRTGPLGILQEKARDKRLLLLQ